jgi:hypothetical protein
MTAGLHVSALIRDGASSRTRGEAWLEWHRELRRHAGDARLPSDLRIRLRERARKALERSGAAAAPAPLARQALRDLARPPFPQTLLDEAAAVAAAAGVPRDRPVVIVETGRRPDLFTAAVDMLIARGFCVVRIGETTDAIGPAGVLDLTAAARPAGPLELGAALAARLVVCEAPEIQQLTWLTRTPSLRLNARDPFSAYPIRADSLFSLATAVDLDTGATLGPAALMSEAYLRNRRNYGFRPNRAAEVLTAVEELIERAAGSVADSAEQASFRKRVADAGISMAPRIPFVAQWGPDEGFIGDGRLARWQAEVAERA